MDLPKDVLNVIIALSILVGALQCFFGYRIFKIILAITGFFFVGAFAGAVGYAASGDEFVALLSGLIGGIIGAALMVAIYFIGVFFIGAFLGAIVGLVLLGMVGNEPNSAILLVLAVISGVIALLFQRFMIIVATSFGGSWTVVVGTAYFTTSVVDPSNIGRLFQSGGMITYAILLCWLVLGIAGVIVQYRTAPQKESTLPEPPEPVSAEP